jgi:hypothetical protein
MSHSKSDAGLVGRSARVVHSFVREQVLLALAPVYLLRYGRVETETPPADVAGDDRPARAIDLYPSSAGRS